MRCGLQTEQEMERLRADLTTQGHHGRQHHVDRIRRISSSQGVPPAQDAAFRQAAAEVQVNFDRSSGSNGTYTFAMKPNIQLTLREEAVVQARQTIERRVNELGVTEPSIAQQGTDGDQILVQLPGVTDVDRAKEIIRSTGSARAEDRRAGPGGDARGAAGPNGQVPPGMEIVPGVSGVPGRSAGAGPCTTWSGRSRPSPARICGTRGRRSTRTTSRRSASR